MSVNLVLTCDECGGIATAVNPLELPLTNGGRITLSVQGGGKSPDFCRRCLSELVLGLLNKLTEPEGITFGYKSFDDACRAARRGLS